MNIISYNIYKYRKTRKLNIKDLSFSLEILPKRLKQLESGKENVTQEELEKIVKFFNVDKQEFSNEITETINTKEKKVYGTSYSFFKYKVLDYKNHYCNTISAYLDLLFFILFIISLIFKVISVSLEVEGILATLKIITIIELCVFPFMYIVFPLLKIYYNITYVALLTSNVKEEDKDEACCIIYSFLPKSINKSIVPHIFTIFSNGVICLYCLLTMIISKTYNVLLIIMVIVFIVSFVISIICLSYCAGKKQNKVLKENEE